jgi:hypothetical protein
MLNDVATAQNALFIIVKKRTIVRQEMHIIKKKKPLIEKVLNVHQLIPVWWSY